MKRLYVLLLVVVFNVLDARKNRRIKSNSHTIHNSQLCFNNVPRNFGTTHFIVGYHGNSGSKKEHKKHRSVVHKKQNSVTVDALIDSDRMSQSFFTTEHDLSPILLEVMGRAKKCLYIAAFSLTDKRMVNCIIDAHNNGVEVCIITDANNMKQIHSKIQLLVSNNVPVWYYDHTLNPRCKKNGLAQPCMHHKIIIVDDEIVVTGSANFTRSGQNSNIENINILRDSITIEEYLAEFTRLKQFCIRCLSQQQGIEKMLNYHDIRRGFITTIPS